ncbi:MULTISPECIES: cytochrome c1 [Henriciella]|jgi:ubiquinol-cytochrome c reductase cytochrome c1 subunit|uniref:Cytochrome c1 n=1 Tax=Henriciella pelagia TaxID=1977912 RepID=A0ABQ1JCP1_9PROT|nr:cytochrome c1 [Henriciella pelagia]GGB65580.1 ubiquinol cytochrome C oxidoreductase [Henriciella pelagia]
MNFLRFVSAGLGAIAVVASANAAGGALHAHGPEEGWAFEGPLGQLDMESVQRGYQVYREVCASCHSMRMLSYRNLGEPGGPFYDPEYPNANDNPLVKSFAAMDEILDTEPNDVGDYDYRPARTSDTFKAPYPNANAARAANGGALPPDLSVITKARHGGASYIYSLMTGYPSEEAISTVEIEAEVEAPAEGEEAAAPAGPTTETLIDPSRIEALSHGDHHYEGTLVQPVGQYYNPYMAGDTTAQWRGDPRHAPPGGFLAMPPQLTDGRVSYLDGTEATVEQMAKDVANFLQWAGEPKQSQRKSTGLAALIYLVILAVLLWFSFHRIWRKVDH